MDIITTLINGWITCNFKSISTVFQSYQDYGSDNVMKVCAMEPRLQLKKGRLGGAMVLGNLPVPGASYNLDDSRARAYCAYSRCGWGCLDIFTLIYLFSPLSPSVWDTA